MSCQEGTITLIFGPANSGKTNELQRKMNRYLIMNKSVVVILPKIDESQKDNVLNKYSPVFIEFLTESFDEESVLRADVIAIDNLHFFQDSIWAVQLLCNKYGKIVICAGLDSNSDREYYPNVMNLIPKCDSAYKLTGLCSVKCDSSKGIFSKRIDGKMRTVSREAYLEKGCGLLHVITGPMFSGKTTELIRITRQYQSINKKIMVINYSRDTRYDSEGNISSHNREILKKTLSLENLDSLLTTHYDLIQEVDVIIIDEIQFFRNSFDIIRELVENENKVVVVSGLDGDYLQNPFGDICKLSAFCEYFLRLNAICQLSGNFSDAHFTRRLVSSDKTELIGSTDSYIAVSRKVYNLPEYDFRRLMEMNEEIQHLQ
jgi:thymidine kinase